MNISENYQTIIWDWNGTIVNDVDLCVNIANNLLTVEGLPTLTKDSYRSLFGFPIRDYYQRIGIDFTIRSMEELTQQFIHQYRQGIQACPLQENIPEILEKFHHQGKLQFVLTAAHTKMAHELLAYCGLIDYFIEIAGLDNHRAASKVERGKDLISKHDIDVLKAIMIGDTVHDLEVANELGIDCLLISRGHQSRERLVKAAIDEAIVLDDLSGTV